MKEKINKMHLHLLTSHLIYKSKHGVCVSVCVSHDVLRFNTMAKSAAIRNPITKKKSQQGGQTGGGRAGKERAGGSSTGAFCTGFTLVYIISLATRMRPFLVNNGSNTSDLLPHVPILIISKNIL